MKEVWFFLSRTNTGYVQRSKSYNSFEEANDTRNKVRSDSYGHEEPITPVMKGYEKE